MLDSKQRQNWCVTAMLTAGVDNVNIKLGVTGKRHVITRLHYLVITAAAFNVDFKAEIAAAIMWRIPSTMANNNSFAIQFEQGYPIAVGEAFVMQTPTAGAVIEALAEGYTENVT